MCTQHCVIQQAFFRFELCFKGVIYQIIVSQIYYIFLVPALSIGFAQEFDLESELLLVSVGEDVHF